MLPHFGYTTVKNSQQGAEDKIQVGAGPRGEMFARAVHRKRAKHEYLQLFLKVLMETFHCSVIKKSACVKLYSIQQED